MKDVIKLFEEGIGISEIKKLTRLTQDQIKVELVKHDYLYYYNNPAKAWNLKQAAQDYANGLGSLTKLSKKYQVQINYLSNTVRHVGINVINIHNQCKFDEHIFDFIDTEEKAYWLGFIFADGTISSHSVGKKPRYQFELSLSLKDKSHLDKFNVFMRYKGNNVKYNSYRCRWVINNKHLWETLNSLGCVPNKSLILQFPKYLERQLIPHFIRGYFDGDGSLGIYITKYNPRIYCQCVGTNDFLTNILTYCEITINLGHDIRCSDEVFNFQLCGEKCYYYLLKIYRDSTIHLNRKYQKFIEVCRLWEESHKLLLSKNGEA